MRVLVRHFFSGLFDLGFLTDAGVSALPRTIATTAGVIFAVGCIAARVFMLRYAPINWADRPLLYEQAVVTDHFFLIAAPMWIVAFVTVLVGPSLFPDETDFRVLMAMPLSRRLIFGSKLIALVLFVALFMLIAQVASVPVFTVTAMSPWATHSYPAFLGAFLIAGVLGAAFAALAVTAVHAGLLLLVPRQFLLPASAVAGSLMLFLLVLAVPFVGHVPAFENALALPPAWFVAVERWLLGDARYAGLAAVAAASVAVAGLVAAVAYLFLYRHFDRVMVRPASDGSGLAPTAAARPQKTPRRPALTAVRTFTMLTLRRSVLHQGVLVSVAALGAALVANSLLGIYGEDAPENPGWRHRQLMATAIWAPFVLMFVSSFAVRASLLIPIEGRANWVFRMTEQPATRADQLEGAGWVLRLLGVGLPVLVAFPLQWLALGTDAIATSAMALVAGALLIELILYNWRRVPFTCSYLAGKGFIPQVLLKGLLAFLAFTTIGGGLAALTRTAAPAIVAPTFVVLIAIVVLLRRISRRHSAREPLEFEDLLPTEANPLRLSAD